MNARSTSPGDQGFAQRLSPLIAACGVVAVPALLVRHQARLQLSNAEIVYLLHVLSFRWDADHWPWVAVSTIAEAAGVHTGVVRRWKASLETKGYLTCHPRVLPGVGRRADEHDLSRLFAALEALALEEETQKALDEVRSDLPDAQYHRGLSTTPQLSTGRPNKNVRARPHENPGARGNENAGAPPAKTLGRALTKMPGEEEDVHTEAINRIQQEKPTEETINRGSASRSEQTASVATNVISAQPGNALQPGYLDDGINHYIEEWGAEFGDDDQQRSIERAHRLWWNSKLERWRFHNAMKLARHTTLKRLTAGQVGGRPMAYFFSVLAGAAADECVKAGQSLPHGWEQWAATEDTTTDHQMAV